MGFFIMYNPDDTICAISTPAGVGALAIVRLSGQNSKNISENSFKGGKIENKKATFGHIVDSNEIIIDEVVIIWYKAPGSYTAEDMIEVICHGGHVVSQQILELFCSMGARLAQPGEFTLRAFLNGRLDLTEAEAVNSVITAKTLKSKQLATFNLEGKLRHKLEKVNSGLFELITIMEAEIDFSDEEIDKLSYDKIQLRLSDIETHIEDLLATYDIGRIAEGKAQIAIVGAPNVGKSSLFNALLKSERAIVTDTPGTTRDYITEYVNIGGYPVIMTDTAGIRQSDQEVEIVGVNRSKELISNVDICIFILDASRPINDEDREIAEYLDNYEHILVVNKADLMDKKDYKLDNNFSDCKPLYISALQGTGLDTLIKEIQKRLVIDSTKPTEGVLLSQRQYDCAKRVQKSIRNAGAVVAQNESEEIIVSLLKEALYHIGELTGRITNEEILNNIFSKFCIGK